MPKVMVDVLTLRAEVAALSWIAEVFDALPSVADNVTASAVVTEVTVAVNPALVAPAATVTEEGTVIAAWLLERLTTVPPAGAAALRVTVQASVPAPV